MKRTLHVQLIKQYILESRVKPFEEVTDFANEIVASVEELEAAIYEAVHEKSLQTTIPQKVTEDAKLHHRPRIIRHLKKILLVLLILGGIGAGGFFGFTKFKSLLPTQIQVAVPIAHSSNPLHITEVYANQKPLSSNQIFSFPVIPVTLTYTNTPQKQVVGFFPYWMIDAYDKVNTHGYSAVNFFGLETDGNGNIITQSAAGPDGGWQMWNDPSFNTFLSNLKKQKIKRLITIKTFNNTHIEQLVNSDKAQETFISNILQLVNSKDLDGVNLDFEYQGTADDQTKQGFVRLVANLQKALHNSFASSILTINTYITSGSDDNFFNLTALEPYVDTFIVMGYDIHTPQGEPGPIAPFEGANGIIGYVESYLQQISPQKLILAVPYYGYDWTINSDAPAKMLSYAEIADFEKTHQVLWDDSSETPAIRYQDSNGQNHAIFFENARSLGIKYDYVNSKQLAGVGIWAMGYDGYNLDLTSLLFDKFTTP